MLMVVDCAPAPAVDTVRTVWRPVGVAAVKRQDAALYNCEGKQVSQVQLMSHSKVLLCTFDNKQAALNLCLASTHAQRH